MDINTLGQINLLKLQYQWKINNFCTGCYKVSQSMRSPMFSCTNCDKEYKWQLILYPKSISEESKDHISVFLQSHNSEIVKINYEISILNSRKEKFRSYTGEHTFPGIKDWGYENFLERSSLLDPENDLMKNDELLIFCEISLDINSCAIEESRNKQKLNVKLTENLYRLKEFNDFEKLLDNNEFSDIIIQINEKKFYAHKSILANRSSVFAAMFKHDMKEKQENIIEIVDTGYEEFKEMLKFIYCGKVSELQKFAKELLALANKYNIDGLKFMCERSLCEQLCSNNAVEYLNLADLYNANVLRFQSMNFIIQNIHEITSNSEFRQIGNMDTDLICELFSTLALKLKK